MRAEEEDLRVKKSSHCGACWVEYPKQALMVCVCVCVCVLASVCVSVFVCSCSCSMLQRGSRLS